MYQQLRPRERKIGIKECMWEVGDSELFKESIG